MDRKELNKIKDHPILNLIKLKNPRSICFKIEEFIKKKVEELERNGIILGLSGGIDSVITTFLCSKALGSEKVYCIYMPEKDSQIKHAKDAYKIVENLDVNFEILNLTTVLESLGIYDTYPMSIIRLFPSKNIRGWILDKGKNLYEQISDKDIIIESRKGTDDSLVAGGKAYANIKHRLRLTVLNYFADLNNLLTIGCANQTEYLTGVFTKFGIDGIADLMPILPLFKTQVKQIANTLKIPENIKEKPADPDIIPGLSDKDHFFKDELTLDITLYAIKNNMGYNQIKDIPTIDENYYEKIISLMNSTQHMREHNRFPILE